MYLLFAFFAGIFLLIRFVGAGYLRRAKKTPAYLPQMLNRNHLYYKSKTTARYVLALTILNVCAVFYFLFQVVSVTIAEEPEVCIRMILSVLQMMEMMRFLIG